MYLFIISIIYPILLIFLVNFVFKKYNYLIYFPKKNHKESFDSEIIISGGVIIFLSLFTLKITYFENIFDIYLLLFISTIFVIGLLSDLKEIDATLRLILITLITLSYIWISNKFILDLKFEFINDFFDDYILVAIIFTTLCFVILINGFNFIDGVHGLTLLFSIVIIIILNYFLFFILKNDFKLNETILILPSLVIIFILNIKEKMFIGDSGSYVLALFLGVTIVNFTSLKTHSFPYVYGNLLIYPAYEVFFSIIRKLYKKANPLEADRKHLHHLFQKYFENNFNINTKNSKIFSCCIINIFVLFFCLVSVHFYQFKYIQIINIFTFCLIYTLIYYLLSRKLKKIYQL
tara:strand:- start:103 stop:1149 length:1047 start_codon:yes stop_codon:yes gene_type:complete